MARDDTHGLRGMPRFLGALSTHFRRRRMARFAATFPPELRRRVVDLGGTPQPWQELADGTDVVLVNRDSLEIARYGSAPARNWRFVLGDATDTGFADGSFDLAYSNSVIEHVGDLETQRRLAREMLRIGKSVWCQTPSRLFFFEPHLMTFFLHWLPARWQAPLVRWFTLWGWIHRPDRGHARAYVAMTRHVSLGELRAMFPGCEVWVERVLGWSKSYVVYRLGPGA